MSTPYRWRRKQTKIGSIDVNFVKEHINSKNIVISFLDIKSITVGGKPIVPKPKTDYNTRFRK